MNARKKIIVHECAVIGVFGFALACGLFFGVSEWAEYRAPLTETLKTEQVQPCGEVER